MAFRWPTDPAGKAASHSISWDAHQSNLKGKQAAPAAPAAPAGPTTAPLPVDASYDAEIGSLYNKRDQGNAEIEKGRQRGLADYGFTETPVTGALAFDPNNPFSKAALLKQSYDTGRARAAQQMGSGGQLYSGAFQNQQDLINRGQLQGEDSLQKSLIGFLANNTAQGAQVRTDFEMGAIGAGSDRVERALNNPLYSPMLGDQGGIGTAASATSPAAATSAPKPVAKKGLTIKAGPNVKATKNTTVSKKKKGRTVTYTTSVKGP